MQRVLDPTMAANAAHHSLRDVLSVKGERGDEIARLFTGFPGRSHRALRCRFNEAAVFKPRPLLNELAIEHADAGGQNTDGAFFVTTVSFIDASGRLGHIRRFARIEPSADFIVQIGVVALESHAIVSALFEKFCTELFLRVERVAGQHRTFEVKLFDSLNGTRDFVLYAP